jgi:pantoate--beta-alanine ligase
LKTFTHIQELKSWLHEIKIHQQHIGLIPTMGALHPGHLSLIEKAKQENEVVVASIFVNPLQFNDKTDLEKYPRTLQADIEKLSSVQCDALFAPTPNEMYPTREDTLPMVIDFGGADKIVEGFFRPGHFAGVCTVVKKLFDIIEPHGAYFGEKDYQQLVLVYRMVEKLKLPVRIVPVKTMREEDGLAMSSRNVRLTEEERKHASFIYKTLVASMETNYTLVSDVAKWAADQLNSIPFFKLEYFEIVKPDTFEPVKRIEKNIEYRACIAVKTSTVRLIDNVVFVVR